MAGEVSSTEDLLARIDEYANWVEQYRNGYPVPEIRAAEHDPLGRLGLQLHLLAKSLDLQERKFKHLFELVETVEQGVLLQDVLDRVFDGFTGIIPFERIGCAFLSEDGTHLTAYWARSELGPVQISGGYSQPLAGSSLERILATGKPRIINDLEAYLERKPHSESTRNIVREGGRASLTCPLVADGKPIGFLFFTSRLKNAYARVHQDTFRRIAGQVSIVIDKSRIHQEIVDRNRELVEQGRKLADTARRDPLTGVLNRGAIMNTAEQMLETARRSGHDIGVIMTDVDHFKLVNDSLGHAAGDMALKEFTRRISRVLRQGDQFGRYGGEEFVIVVDGASCRSLGMLAERLRLRISAGDFDLNGTMLHITASFGIALSDRRDMTIAELVASADRALYRAKNTGRDCVVMDDSFAIRSALA